MPYILLVEDDPCLIDIYRQKLEESDFEVDVVESGDKVFAALAKRKPDLLLLDIVLPGMAGWEILRKLKEEDGFSGLKVVVLSNLSQQEEVEKGLDLGAVKYLIKTQFKPSEVVEKVKEIIKG